NEKSKLAKARQLLFDSANEKFRRAKGGVGFENKPVISQKNWKGIAKAENCTIDPILLNSGKVTFSGTDNGLISMTRHSLKEDTHLPLTLDTEGSESLKNSKELSSLFQ
ncbi:hypothetical protein CU098_005920, partial [Rhizopus stolonifer]